MLDKKCAFKNNHVEYFPDYSSGFLIYFTKDKNVRIVGWVLFALIYALIDLKTKVYFALNMPNQ